MPRPAARRDRIGHLGRLRRLGRPRRLVPLAVLAVAIATACSSGWVDASSAATVVRATSELDVRLSLIGLAVAIAAIANRGLMNQAAHRSVGLEPGAGEMIATASVGFSAQKIVKSGGLSGLAVFVHRGRQHGHSPSHVTGACLLVAAASFVAFGVALATAVGALWWQGRMTGWWIAAAIGVAAYGSGAVALAVLARRHRAMLFRGWVVAHRVVARVRRRPQSPPDPRVVDDLFAAIAAAAGRRRDIWRMVAHAMAGKVAGALLLLIAARAAGHALAPGDAFIVYAMVLGASFVSVVPGGFGVVEASTAALLVAGGAAGSAAALTVALFRVFDMWVPLAIGLAAARRTLTNVAVDMPVPLESTRPAQTIASAVPGHGDVVASHPAAGPPGRPLAVAV